jgi:uncharacterized protein (TIGR02284 family)
MSRANPTNNPADTTSAAQASDDAATLAAILAACADGERGYRAAAKDVSDAGCAQMFDHYAAERSRFGVALQEAAHRRREPSAPGSVAGALHRGWMGARAKLTHGKAHALVAECARGEEAALHAYREALRANLSPGLRELVQEQYDAVKVAHAELTAVLDAGAA